MKHVIVKRVVLVDYDGRGTKLAYTTGAVSSQTKRSDEYVLDLRVLKMQPGYIRIRVVPKVDEYTKEPITLEFAHSGNYTIKETMVDIEE